MPVKALFADLPDLPDDIRRMFESNEIGSSRSSGDRAARLVERLSERLSEALSGAMSHSLTNASSAATAPAFAIAVLILNAPDAVIEPFASNLFGDSFIVRGTVNGEEQTFILSADRGVQPMPDQAWALSKGDNEETLLRVLVTMTTTAYAQRRDQESVFVEPQSWRDSDDTFGTIISDDKPPQDEPEEEIVKTELF